MQLLIQSVLLVLSGAMDLMRSALCVLASEDTGAKGSMLPVAWVGAVMMAAAAVLGMPEKAHAGSCWTNVSCGGKHPYYCKDKCGSAVCNGSGWAFRPFPGTLEYRCWCTN